MSRLDKGSKIIIVGAGVFGLSTALYLAKNGFYNVTIFDQNVYQTTLYDQSKGCDAASADVNKILRASYGDKADYQRLAYHAREEWKRWNAEINAMAKHQRPPGLEDVDELYHECGFLRLTTHEGDPLSEDEMNGLTNLEKEFPENRLKNYIIDNPVERQRAFNDGWGDLLDAVPWRGTGVLDTTAGYVRADKACIWLSAKVRQLGVAFIEGPLCGKVVELAHDTLPQDVIRGIRTADGKSHLADLTIVAGGGWTPTLVPATRKLLETTGGSVISIQLPPLQPDLWKKYSRWPVISRDKAELYSLPQLNGIIKIGYRETKYTNYVELSDNSHVSVPITAYTTPSETNIPLQAMESVKSYIRTHFPDLVPYGISYTRLCWYTDSIDNDFLVDYVPQYNRTLFVASGGSGHGFKFAPILGLHILDALMGVETELTNRWRWRPVPDGRRNGLEEGEAGPRVLSKQKMATKADWKFIL